MSELSNIKQELRNIIKEVETFQSDVKKGLEGIGTDICAKRCKYLLDNRLYRSRNDLNNLNTSKLSEAFKAAQQNK